MVEVSPPHLTLNTDQKKDYIIVQLLKKVALLESKSKFDDEQGYVDDTIRFFQQPHMISAVVCVVSYLLYLTWTQSPTSSLTENTKTGIFAVIFFILILGMLVFPTSGPFSRPFPLLWRTVFGLAVIYEAFLLIILFQTKDQARWLMTFLDSTTGTPLVERSYAEACGFTWENIAPNIFDRFAVAHFLGWFLKSMIIRDLKLCWVISIGWEFIEIIFTPMLPNFAECWWDQWLLDVLICNGLGIFAGHWVQQYFQMMQHDWSSAYLQPIYTKKSKKLLTALGLRHLATASTEESQSVLESHKWGFSRALKRFFGIQFIVLVVQLQELNAFFLKQLLWLPPESYLNPARLVLWCLFSLPCVRQFYLYFTDPHIKTIGKQSFLCLILMATELMIIFKFSPGEFKDPYPFHLKVLVAVLFLGYLLFTVWGVYSIYRAHPTEDVHRKVATNLQAAVHTGGITHQQVHSMLTGNAKPPTTSPKNIFDLMDGDCDACTDDDDDLTFTGEDSDAAYDDLFKTFSPIHSSNLHFFNDPHHLHANPHNKQGKKRSDTDVLNDNDQNTTPQKNRLNAAANDTLIKFTDSPHQSQTQHRSHVSYASKTSVGHNLQYFEPRTTSKQPPIAAAAAAATSHAPAIISPTESDQHRNYRQLLKSTRPHDSSSASNVPSTPTRLFARKPVSQLHTESELEDPTPTITQPAPSSKPAIGNNSDPMDDEILDSVPKKPSARGTPIRRARQPAVVSSSFVTDDDEEAHVAYRRQTRTTNSRTRL